VAKAQKRATLSSVNIYFAPPANGRPTPFFKEAVVYDSDEHRELVRSEQTGAPGDLFLLPPLPPVLQQNLLMYLSHADVIGKELKAMNWLNFFFSGSPDYRFNNWLMREEEAEPLRAGTVYNETGGWRVLDQLQVHDTVFFQDRDHLHAALYLGGRMLLHKLSSRGPVWISTFRELFDLTGRWEKAHVRKSFAPDKMRVFRPS